MDIEFYAYETRVKVVGTNIEAIVKGVCVRGRDYALVEYDIVYWVNGKRETDWVKNFEIEPVPITKPAGFKNYDDTPLLNG